MQVGVHNLEPFVVDLMGGVGPGQVAVPRYGAFAPNCQGHSSPRRSRVSSRYFSNLLFTRFLNLVRC